MSLCSSPPPLDLVLSPSVAMEYSTGLGQPRFSIESALQNPAMPSSSQAMATAAGFAQQYGVSDMMIIQIAQFLPEEILYHCRNPAYMTLLRQQQYLQRQVDESNRQRDTCVGEIKGTKAMYDILLKRIDSAISPSSPGPIAAVSALASSTSPIPSVPPHTPLQEKDYPHVRFWHKSTFTNTRNDTKTSKATRFTADTNSTNTALAVTAYLEDEDGNPLSKEKIASINALARSIWNVFWDSDCAPANYTSANDHHLRYFRYRLGQQCPELYLGEGYWKFQQLWSINYGSWRSTKDVRPETRIKQERILDRDCANVDTDNSSVTTDTSKPTSEVDKGDSRKRAAVSSQLEAQPAKKRVKVEFNDKRKQGNPLAGVRVAPKPRQIRPSFSESNERPSPKASHSTSVHALPDCESGPILIEEEAVVILSSEGSTSDKTSGIATPQGSIVEDIQCVPPTTKNKDSVVVKGNPEEPTPDGSAGETDPPVEIIEERTTSLQPQKKLPVLMKSPPADSAGLSQASVASKEPSGSSEVPRGVTVVKKKAKRTLKVKVFVPGAAHTPKNVCARLWVQDNPGGTKDDFETYFGSLTVAAANEFKKQAAALKKNQ